MQPPTMTDLKSSYLAAAGYDDENKRLWIRFHGGEGKPKPVFYYSDVPYERYQGLLKADSPGSYFHAHIRKQHVHTPWQEN